MRPVEAGDGPAAYTGRRLPHLRSVSIGITSLRDSLAPTDSTDLLDRAVSNDSITWQKPVDLIEFPGMMRSPFNQGIQDGPQAFAERGEQVFDPLTILGAGLPAHHSMFL